MELNIRAGTLSWAFPPISPEKCMLFCTAAGSLRQTYRKIRDECSQLADQESPTCMGPELSRLMETPEGIAESVLSVRKHQESFDRLCNEKLHPFVESVALTYGISKPEFVSAWLSDSNLIDWPWVKMEEVHDEDRRLSERLGATYTRSTDPLSQLLSDTWRLRLHLLPTVPVQIDPGHHAEIKAYAKVLRTKCPELRAWVETHLPTTLHELARNGVSVDLEVGFWWGFVIFQETGGISLELRDFYSDATTPEALLEQVGKMLNA